LGLEPTLHPGNEEGGLAFILLQRILETVQSSGANQTEALSAVDAAKALIPSLRLKRQSTVTF
jgi:hypothetical protein